MQTAGRAKPHELRVSTLAMFMLLLFNEEEVQQQGISVQQIMQRLQIDEPSCRKTLASLTNQKVRILKKLTIGGEED